MTPEQLTRLEPLVQQVDDAIAEVVKDLSLDDYGSILDLIDDCVQHRKHAYLFDRETRDQLRLPV